MKNIFYARNNICPNRELQNGIALVDDKNAPLDVQSKNAAFDGISAVVMSRVGMACPGMGKFPDCCLQFWGGRGSRALVLYLWSLELFAFRMFF